MPKKLEELQRRFAFPPISPNDLRRTCATWLRQHQTEPHLIGSFLGHKDSRMAGRKPAYAFDVNGETDLDELAARIATTCGNAGFTKFELHALDRKDLTVETEKIDRTAPRQAARRRDGDSAIDATGGDASFTLQAAVADEPSHLAASCGTDTMADADPSNTSTEVTIACT
jgi:hypothetical protein